MPCATPPLKELTKASFEQRVAMLELATKPITNMIIDKRERNRSGKSFTVDSLSELKRENPSTRLVLVVGGDTLETMESWHKIEALCELCHLLVVNRPEYSLDNIDSIMIKIGFSCAKNKQELEIQSAGRYYCHSIEEKSVSSTSLREKFANKNPIDDLLSGNVAEYIRDNQLY